MSGIRHSKPSKDELEKAYSTPGESLSSLAKMFNTTHPTIRVWLKSYGIEIKSNKSISKEKRSVRQTPSREELIYDYIFEEMSLIELQRKYCAGQSTIYQWLSSYNIEARTLSESTSIGKTKQYAAIRYSKEQLEEAFKAHNNNKILVADSLGISYSYLKKLITTYNMNIVPSYISKGQLDLLEYCINLRPDYTWLSCDRSAIAPFELDIYCPELNLAIEYCGIYWHSEISGSKDKLYHQDKWKACRDNGIQLITIFESDDVIKVKALLKKKITKTNKVFARNCNIVQVSSKSARAFHEKHHLHGYVNSSISYGLEMNGELLLVLSMGKSRYNNSIQWECTRISSAITVVGGVSKLFARFRKDHDPDSIITFADLRFGDGTVYKKIGFEDLGVIPPNYWYHHKSDRSKLKSRVAYQKHKLINILDIFDPNITEFENMKNNGYDRIWDCGNAKFIWRK